MNTVITILNLIPAIIAALKAIEEAIPGNGQGEQKLAAVRQVLEIADGSLAKLWPQLQQVISVLVNLFNTTGVFKK